MKRRDVLKTAGALAAASFLESCGKKPGKVDTLLYLMMENRSYDHALGARALLEGKPGDGLSAVMSNKDSSGAPVAPFAAGAGMMCVPDPPHNWTAAHASFNGGANDGFLVEHQKIHAGDLGPMQYLTRDDQPITWALADAYASCDRWFSSVMGPTWPNRYYWLSGTSSGINSNHTPIGGVWSTPTIFHRLDDAGVDWRIYYNDLPFVALMGTLPGIDLDRHAFTIDHFYADAKAGKLPPVCWIDPAFTSGDDHPPHHPILGQKFIADVYNALTASPQWERSLMLVTYDEHGGFYDHVAPPKAPDDLAAQGFDQLGFRVPALAISPWVKAGHVSSVERNHASALKHIELLHGTAPLTVRTTAAADLSELFDAQRLASGTPLAAAKLPAIDLSKWNVDASCNGPALPEHSDILAFADAHPELVARWDRR